MELDPNVTMKNEEPDLDANIPPERGDNKLVRVIKSIVVNPERGRYVDDTVVRFQHYNSFNYSMLRREPESLNVTLGITSASPREGKTLVASNLAVSLAMGSQKNTVLVDLNVLNPRLHEIFGIAKSPGLFEAFQNGSIHISGTAVDHLFVLAAGNVRVAQDRILESEAFSDLSTRSVVKPMVGLEQLPSFRDIIYSLEQEFEFVIVDMPSMNSEGVPVLFANQLNGLIVVIDNRRTRREDVEAMFKHVNERQVLGFVFNRFRQ